MTLKLTMSLAALILGGTLSAGTAFAQHTGARSADDNGIPTAGQSTQSQSMQPNDYYDQSNDLYNQEPGMGTPDDQGAVAACEARFRSYDPASGTYMGYDGRRHPCP